jgi:hypothetical protein
VRTLAIRPFQPPENLRCDNVKPELEVTANGGMVLARSPLTKARHDFEHHVTGIRPTDPPRWIVAIFFLLCFAGCEVRRIITALNDLERCVRKRQDHVGTRQAPVARFSLGVQAGQECPILVQIESHSGEFENCGIARERLDLGCSPCF